ncbi:PREDICTED: two-component response regulator-like APRR5 isoform X2 [Lupinus angustifolius]|uniref:two-component response regulator-like APRR5 isoform X2 n=1 Tax=Lupinus angustifolius TaxID=3871 RepID=UPI00092FA3E7|nr:PREDICTED: two-component response regulator-like APRR5 isoform X2 [Lupinus angustifolius]
MGDLVMSGEKLKLVGVEEEKIKELKGLMRWEKFLPKMVLRVLLVEADDSTRQIIAALLRKCNYKVAAVPDGLKAWEILKGRPHSIDLILTEVDLPSISGYALLTLIMEHDICKNIPVIMMSSQDSVSTVYKCMLRGAADYLVKPLRKNELRNLWQHVWRRQQSTIGMSSPQEESTAQQKVEATAENNATSNRSTGSAACSQRNKEMMEKGSDAHSSCTKPDLEAESDPVETMREYSPLTCGEAYPNGTNTQEVETCIRLGQTLIKHDSHDGGLTMDISKNGEASTTSGKDGDHEHFRGADVSGEAHDNDYAQISSFKEAIDLIGAFQTRPNCSVKNSAVDCTGKFDFSPQLDLSLRRSQPSNFENELSEERHTLVHSNASAFKRYTNRPLLQAAPAMLVNFSDQQREQRTNCEKSMPHITTGCNSDSSTSSTQRCIMSPATTQSKESEFATSHSQQAHSLPIPVKGVRFNDICAAYGSVLPPMFCTQSGPQSMSSPSSVVFLEPTFQVNAFYPSNIRENSSEKLYEPHGPNGDSAPKHMVYTQGHRSEYAEDRECISPANNLSVSSSFCNENASHINHTGYRSNCGISSKFDQVATVRSASEGKNEDLTNNGSSHRPTLREAALNKFRLKRKERCYEKKVRYESRKKLAEQRPRVKGQFVRQAQPDPLSIEKVGNEYQ